MTDTIPTTIQPVSEDWLRAWGESYRKRLGELDTQADEAALELRKIFLWLKSRNPELDHIEVSYDGAGDSGQVEDIECWGRNPAIPSFLSMIQAAGIDDPLPDAFFDGEPQYTEDSHWDPVEREMISTNRRNASPSDLLDQLAWDLAYGKNPGFENNEGGYGTVRIGFSEDDPERIAVTLSHSNRIIVTDDYAYEF